MVTRRRKPTVEKGVSKKKTQAAAKGLRDTAQNAASAIVPAPAPAPAVSPVLAPAPASTARQVVVERVQTGFRMEKRLLKVLKAVAEYHDMALGDLVEGIVLHAFDGRPAFGPESLQRIAEFKRLYGLELDSSHAHRLTEKT
jgi:hypothetical protein